MNKTDYKGLLIIVFLFFLMFCISFFLKEASAHQSNLDLTIVVQPKKCEAERACIKAFKDCREQAGSAIFLNVCQQNYNLCLSNAKDFCKSQNKPTEKNKKYKCELVQ